MKNKVFIGTPAYDGRVHVTYALMLMDLSERLKERGFEVMIRIPTMGSLLVANRNKLVQMFMESGGDWMICLDSDISFNIEYVFKVISDNLDCFAGVYPLRDKSTFVFRPVTDKNGRIITSEDQRYLKMEYTPAGFMMFQRHVIEAMQKKFPHLHYTSPDELSEGYAFFNTELFDGQFWGEDYVFCRRVREAGFDILTDPSIVFDHDSVMGSLMETLTEDPTKARIG